MTKGRLGILLVAGVLTSALIVAAQCGKSDDAATNSTSRNAKGAPPNKQRGERAESPTAAVDVSGNAPRSTY